jgi:hypothetical protein
MVKRIEVAPTRLHWTVPVSCPSLPLCTLAAQLRILHSSPSSPAPMPQEPSLSEAQPSSCSDSKL